MEKYKKGDEFIIKLGEKFNATDTMDDAYIYRVEGTETLYVWSAQLDKLRRHNETEIKS